MQIPKFIERAAAAAYIRETWGIPCAAQTLAKLAVIGGGPEYHKVGRSAMYSHTSLDTWANQKLGKAIKSTAELQPAA
jgi:hypothetical protein